MNEQCRLDFYYRGAWPQFALWLTAFAWCMKVHCFDYTLDGVRYITVIAYSKQ